MNQRTDRRPTPAPWKQQEAPGRLTTESEAVAACGADGESARGYVSASVGTDGSFQFSLVLLRPGVPENCRRELTDKAMAALRRALMRAQAAGLPLEGGEKQ